MHLFLILKYRTVVLLVFDAVEHTAMETYFVDLVLLTPRTICILKLGINGHLMRLHIVSKFGVYDAGKTAKTDSLWPVADRFVHILTV